MKLPSDRRNFLRTACVAAALTQAASWAAPAKPRRILLGQSVPLTGAADQIGTAFAGGAKLFFDGFNARSDATGFSFELVQMDDGYDAARAAANARKLLKGGADLLFGFVGAASSQAAAEVAAAERAILFAPFAAPDSLRQASASHVFHVRPSLSDEAFKMVRHCATLGQDRIAVLAEDDVMGRDGLRAVQEAMAELKLPPLVAHAMVPSNSVDVDAAAAAILKGQPQAVIQVSLFNTTAAFIRKMRRSGYAGNFLNFSVVGIDPLFTALGKDIGGVVMTQVVPSPRNSVAPIVKEYLAAIDTSDQTATYESLEGYVAAKALAEAVRRAGPAGDAAALRKVMGAMTDYDVGGFRINLRAGVRDTSRLIELVTIRPDGKIVR